ncbi:hypothetical protein SBA4_560017 [Candidatus Sulfopaludibacter sp. SbA4]|nr:hypothetical protein SBA4_560017 [Candidatus Sulfopaludibacter sp. SbA4]
MRVQLGRHGFGAPALPDGRAMTMKLNFIIPVLLAVLSGPATGQQSEFAIGRAWYTEGEFKKAAAHFELALRADPKDAESCYWMGMSYQMLADIASPLGHSYKAKARLYLMKAVELAPTRADYRRELFNFLADSAGRPRAEAVLGGLFLAVPRAAYRIAE